jgi:hypothetical protein
MTTGRATRQAKETTAMPAILRNTPPGFDWGWFSREDPRMHLQVLHAKNKQESEYKVWLETRGRRTCEADGKIPSKIFKAIQADVTRYRRYIEDRWVRFMILNNWLEAHLSAPQVTLVAYPRTPNAFNRVVDLTKDVTAKEAMKLTELDVVLSVEMASLQIWPQLSEDLRQDVRLSTILWED